MTREEAIDIIKKYDINGCGYCHQGGDEVKEAFDMAIKALEQEPCGKDINVPATDAISREAVEDAIAEMVVNGESLGYAVAWDILSDLPSVTPQPRMGKWSHDGSHWANRFICSECGYKLFEEQTKYCPNCGVKMESEDRSDL